MESALPYEYTKLETSPPNPRRRQPAKRYIRLLKILPPADGTDVICLSLRQADLDEVTNAYNAVSYMWGSEDGLCPAFIDGKKIMLRQNIARFFRHYSTSTWNSELQHDEFWIDAICINQHDLAEKNVQVRQMSHVFKSAEQVLIWLGENSEMSPARQIYGGLKSKYFQYTLRKGWLDRLDEKGREDLCLLDQQLTDLFEDSYWNRLWIIQEVHAAKMASIIVRDGLLSLDVLRFVLDRNERELDHTLPTHRRSDLNLRTHWETVLRRSRHLGNMKVLGQIIYEFRNHGCTLTEDHVYGLLGTVHNGDQFPVAYGRPRQELLFETLRFSYQQAESEIRNTYDSERLTSPRLATQLCEVLGVDLVATCAEPCLQPHLRPLDFYLEMAVHYLYLPTSSCQTEYRSCYHLLHGESRAPIGFYRRVDPEMDDLFWFKRRRNILEFRIENKNGYQLCLFCFAKKVYITWLQGDEDDTTIEPNHQTVVMQPLRDALGSEITVDRLLKVTRKALKRFRKFGWPPINTDGKRELKLVLHCSFLALAQLQPYLSLH